MRNMKAIKDDKLTLYLENIVIGTIPLLVYILVETYLMDKVI